MPQQPEYHPDAGPENCANCGCRIGWMDGYCSSECYEEHSGTGHREPKVTKATDGMRLLNE